MKAFGCLLVECFYLFICTAKIFAQTVGTCATQIVRGKDKRDRGLLFCAQPMNDFVHMRFKCVVVADSRISLGAEKMVRPQPDRVFAFFFCVRLPAGDGDFDVDVQFHARFPSLSRIWNPMKEASTALMTAVGMNGRTQAVMPVTTGDFVIRQKNSTPTT